MLSPCILWFYIVPAITGFLFPKQTMWVEKPIDPDAPLPEDLPEGEEVSLEPEMMEIDAPVSWVETLAKFVITSSIMFLALLLMIWVKQEGMLYVPDQPIKFIEQNPERY